MSEIIIDPSKERHILDFRTLGFRDVLVLGHYIYREAHQPLQIHDHGNCIEICYLAEGHQYYRVIDNDYFLRGGEVLMTYPHEPHSTGFLREGKGNLYWLIIRRPAKTSGFLGMKFEHGKTLYESLSGLPSRHFKLHIGSQKNLESVFTLMATNQTTPPDTFTLINIQNYLLRFLLDLIDAAKTQKQTTVSENIAQAVRQIKDSGDKFYTLHQLARIANLSESRFKHRFKEEIGTTPADYQIRQKIDQARKLLLRPQTTILDTALDLGFSSSQYFATVFRRYTGMTPAEYRASETMRE
ncbi:MAG: AraC family transcriptional regulator [Planctomycetaceae bacterium]|jgi:AraC-like DNA-binding protein|nr:AraC family transcriptional regulator [Planctomycetaceae bacterium]